MSFFRHEEGFSITKDKENYEWVLRILQLKCLAESFQMPVAGTSHNARLLRGTN